MRPTLTNYLKQRFIEATKLPNGRYDYDEKTVYAFLNKDALRKNIIYARVYTRQQKKDLNNQIQSLKN